MKKSSTIFLQAIIVLIGIGTFVFLLWEPHIEGRNAHATLFEIYFQDPFLAYAYTAAIAFFTALYQSFKLLGRIRRGEVFSQPAIEATQIIKYCTLIVAGFAAAGEAFLWIARPDDDIAGGVFMGMLILSISLVIAAWADILEGVLGSVTGKNLAKPKPSNQAVKKIR